MVSSPLTSPNWSLLVWRLSLSESPPPSASTKKRFPASNGLPSRKHLATSRNLSCLSAVHISPDWPCPGPFRRATDNPSLISVKYLVVESAKNISIICIALPACCSSSLEIDVTSSGPNVRITFKFNNTAADLDLPLPQPIAQFSPFVSLRHRPISPMTFLGPAAINSSIVDHSVNGGRN